MTTKKEKHTAIEKALNILTLFMPHNHEMSINEISEALGYHRATTTRTLFLLNNGGYLEHNQQTKKYRLGPAIALLNLSLHRSLEDRLVRIAKPYVDRLRDTLNETIVLEVLSGRTTVRAYAAEGMGVIRSRADAIGQRLPIYAAAGAKAILANLPEESWDHYLDQDIPRMTENTITDINRLKGQLREFQSTGVAIDIGEYDPDINAIGAAIFNTQSKPVAAIVAAGLPSRFKPDPASRFAEEIKSTALEISRALGFSDKP